MTSRYERFRAADRKSAPGGPGFRLPGTLTDAEQAKLAATKEQARKALELLDRDHAGR